MAQMSTEQVARALASLNALGAECAVAQLALDAFVGQTGDLGDGIRGPSPLPHAVIRAAAGTAAVDQVGLERTWAANYFNVKQADLPEERDDTLEQRAALSQWVTGGMLPYADVAVVGPFGRRAEQQNKSRTWIPTGDGTHLTKEIPGPENFRQWQAGWRVFSTLATNLRLAAEDVDWWAEQVTRPAAAGTSRGRRGTPVTVEEQLAAKCMPGFETNNATPKRRRRKDDSSASDDFPPASQKKKLQRAAKRQREKSAKQELEAFRQLEDFRSRNWNKWGVWLQPAKGASKDRNSGLPSSWGKKQHTDVDGKTEICRTWNKEYGVCTGVAVCPMGRAHKCWFCLSTAHTGTEGGCL